MPSLKAVTPMRRLAGRVHTHAFITTYYRLRFLRSRLSDRYTWNGRLLTGTDSLLSTLRAR